VCLKWAVDPATAEYDVETDTLTQPDRVIGASDLVALEQALRLAEEHGGSVCAVTVGDVSADRGLKRALCFGAHAAVRVWDDALNSADSSVVARMLAAAVAHIRADVALCGTNSIDSGSGFVGAALAEHLGWAFVQNVIELRSGGSQLHAIRAGDGGWRAEFEARLPAVLGVDVTLSEPRYVAIMSDTYRRGLLRPIEVHSPASFGLSEVDLRPAVLTRAIGQARPRTKVTANLTKLSMKERLSRMRGQGTVREKELLTVPVEDAARIILERLEEWL
jgi:electron transfer flavoprotein beta subunit